MAFFFLNQTLEELDNIMLACFVLTLALYFRVVKLHKQLVVNL